MASEWERTQRRLDAGAEYEGREEETQRRNAEIQGHLDKLDSTLTDGVRAAPALNYERRMQRVPDPSAVPPPDITPEPAEGDYLLASPGPMSHLMPGWEKRHQARQDNAWDHYRASIARWRRQRNSVEEARTEHLAEVESRKQSALTRNRTLRRLEEDAAAGGREAVEDYVLWALRSSNYSFPVASSVRYILSRKELLLEIEFPKVDSVIPTLASWSHVKTRRAVESKDRTIDDRNRRYKKLLAQITLRAVYECFHVDSYGHVQVVSFKGMVSGVSPISGRPVKPTVISLRVEREDYLDRDFFHVDAVKLLRSFRANVSDQPTELKPIPLVVEFDLSDPRFIEEEDIVSHMDDRANLMDVTPAEFESVITNLFNTMGYKAKQTIRSKDGGVDCIAIYEDPVGIIKCVIQAKKWTAAVGVDAVRDLYGAMTHERASKAILVTTSTVTAGGKKFADDKPMQIVEGNELLGLFEKWTDHKLTIVFPPK